MEEKIKEGYVRVSEVVGQWNDYGNIPKHILESAAIRGSYVHSAIKMHINEDCTLPLNPEYEPYYQSYLRFRDSTNLEIIQSEKRYYSDVLGLTGEIDAIVVTPWSTQPMILDWKTSLNESPANWRLQGGLYRIIAEENGITNLSTNIMFIKLDKFGDSPSLHMYEYDEDLEDFCYSSVVTYFARKRYGSK